MEFKKVISERYSCRSFSNKQVEKEKLIRILEVGNIAPTAKNTQCQKIFVLTDKEEILKIESVKGMYNAPCVLVVCGDENRECKRFYTNKSLMETDVAIVQTYMMLEAKNQGLESCWVCYFNEEEVAKTLNLPKNIIPYNLLLIGYPDENGTPSVRHYERRELSDVIINNEILK